MAIGEKTKLLWEDPVYRKRMSEAHKGKMPVNIGQLVELSKTEKSRLAMSKRMMGKTAWNKGKKSATISRKRKDNHKMRGLFKHRIQKLVFKRDDYTCQVCWKRGGYLQVDHIQSWADYVELRFSIDNCRTLCMDCHYFITFGKPKTEKIRTWGHNFQKARIKL